MNDGCVICGNKDTVEYTSLCAPCLEKMRTREGTADRRLADLVRAHDAAKAKPEAQVMSQEERWAREIRDAGWAAGGMPPTTDAQWNAGKHFALAELAKARELFGSAEEQQRQRVKELEAQRDAMVKRLGALEEVCDTFEPAPDDVISLVPERAGRLLVEQRQRAEGYQAQLTTARDESHRRGEEINRLSRDLDAIVQLPRQYGYEQEAGEQPVKYLRRVLADMQAHFQQLGVEKAQQADGLHAEIERLKAELKQVHADWATDSACKREDLQALTAELEVKAHPSADRKSLDRLCIYLNDLQAPEMHAGQDIADGAVLVLKAAADQVNRLRTELAIAVAAIPQENRAKLVELAKKPAPPQQPDGDDLAKLVCDLAFPVNAVGNVWGELDENEREVVRGKAARVNALIDARIAKQARQNGWRQVDEPKPSDAAPVKVGDKIVMLYSDGSPGTLERVVRVEIDEDRTIYRLPAGCHRTLFHDGRRELWRPATDAEIRAGRALT